MLLLLFSSPAEQPHQPPGCDGTSSCLASHKASSFLHAVARKLLIYFFKNNPVDTIYF